MILSDNAIVFISSFTSNPFIFLRSIYKSFLLINPNFIILSIFSSGIYLNSSIKLVGLEQQNFPSSFKELNNLYFVSVNTSLYLLPVSLYAKVYTLSDLKQFS